MIESTTPAGPRAASQPATARFVSRHMYNFFVADEAPVPQWTYIPPADPDAIELLASTYIESDHDIRSMLRVMFNSDFFKKASFARVKSPAEMVVGAMRLSGGVDKPTDDMFEASNLSNYMGQTLLDPPSVEGWHEGPEWINSGTLVERVNFVARQLGDVERPGTQAIISRLAVQNGGTHSPEQLVDSCLDLMGPVEVDESTRTALVEHVGQEGKIVLQGHQKGDEVEQRVGEVFSLIASAREFQRA